MTGNKWWIGNLRFFLDPYVKKSNTLTGIDTISQINPRRFSMNFRSQLDELKRRVDALKGG